MVDGGGEEQDQDDLNLLFHILEPDSLVSGICRVEGAQPQGDNPGQQQGDHGSVGYSSGTLLY